MGRKTMLLIILSLLLTGCGSSVVPKQKSATTPPVFRPAEFAELKQHLVRDLHTRFAWTTDKTAPVPEQRWIYDDALGILAFTLEGDQKAAAAVLTNLQQRQNKEGSLNFFYSTSNKPVERYVRSGALAWVGYAAACYRREFGDPSFDGFTDKIADYLCQKGAATGKVSGGEGSYAGGKYSGGSVEWYSTEHNIDTYFFFRELGRTRGSKQYSAVADRLAITLQKEFWNEEGKYFQIGSNDRNCTLDTITWGGLFALNQGDLKKAGFLEDRLKEFQITSNNPVRGAAQKTLTGFAMDKPSAGKTVSTEDIWLEGSWGAVLFLLRSGQDVMPLVHSLEGVHRVSKASISDVAWGYLILQDNKFLWR
ncbi:MAG TPA: hypothetical protein VHS59_06595 [Bacillota bacterium]|nr:hypothetical protein [Bacillota bacterium]